MGVSLEVWGPYACFSRPEFKSERVSYDVMTPAAARGILESILYKPAIRWVIDRITVYNPVKTVNVKRVERSEIDKRPDFKKVVDSGKKALRNTNALKDVHYRIDAHFEYTDEKGDRDNDGKFLEMFNHRARTGRCFKQPSLGCREFPAFFKEHGGRQGQHDGRGKSRAAFCCFRFARLRQIAPVYAAAVFNARYDKRRHFHVDSKNR